MQHKDIHFKVAANKIVATTWLSNGDLLRLKVIKEEDPSAYMGTEYWPDLYIGPISSYLIHTDGKTYGRPGRSMIEGWMKVKTIMEIIYRDFMKPGEWIALKGSDKRRDDIYFHKLLGTPISKDSCDIWRFTTWYDGIPNVLILYKSFPPEYSDYRECQFDFNPSVDPNDIIRSTEEFEYDDNYTPEIVDWMNEVIDAINSWVHRVWNLIKIELEYLSVTMRSFLSRIVTKGQPRKSRKS